jgi:endogenous inhibitor of DNA gyrase (YacG/DUF329 family)
MARARCPTCDRQFDIEQTTAMPFCSERCRQVDLGRWLDERHFIQVEKIPDESEEEDFPTIEQGDL